MNILWNTHEGIREQGYCEIAEKGNLEILRKSKTAHEGNCEMLMKGLGNLEILRKSKMAHEGNIKSGSSLKYLLVYFKTKTNISDTAKIVCWQVKKIMLVKFYLYASIKLSLY